jgi:hypothetical protein
MERKLKGKSKDLAARFIEQTFLELEEKWRAEKRAELQSCYTELHEVVIKYPNTIALTALRIIETQLVVSAIEEKPAIQLTVTEDDKLKVEKP